MSTIKYYNAMKAWELLLVLVVSLLVLSWKIILAGFIAIKQFIVMLNNNMKEEDKKDKSLLQYS